MKKTTIIFIGILALTCSSCTKFLDDQSQGQSTEATFWQTDKDYDNAMNAVYAGLGDESTWGRDLFWEQGGSDDIFLPTTHTSDANFCNLDYDPVQAKYIGDAYNVLYTMMARANDLIYHGLKMTTPSDIINKRIGEAYFMRAFSHFMIAYRYGRLDNGVPFDRYEDYNPYVAKIPEQRASVVDNYKLIIEDCDKAIDRLPYFKDYSREDYGRATKDAAIALKVKVYAYWAEYDPAQWSKIPPLVAQLETQAGRGLLPNFADVFKIANNWSSEYIWSVNSSATPIGGSIFPGIVLPNKGWGAYNGWGDFNPTLELYAEYSPQDKRRDATILKYGDHFTYFGTDKIFSLAVDKECGFAFNKYMEPYSYGSLDPVSGAGSSPTLSTNGDAPTTNLNVPIMRFSEMLLFEAEALIEQGKGAQAATVLNRISTRAGMPNLYTNATINDLMHERRCELACEYSDRLKDLKRWSAKYPQAKKMLEEAKHGLKYVNRSDPNSLLDTTVGKIMSINGKTYEGVIQIWPAKIYDADKSCAFPYKDSEVTQSMGALKQNKGY